jgi:hypothetical protein
MLKLATVLEETALVLEKQETAQLSAEKTAHETVVNQLKASYLESTGEELPEDVLQKLASADEPTLSAMRTVVAKTAEAGVARLGSSGEKTAGRAEPRNAREAAQQAYDNFGQYLST